MRLPISLSSGRCTGESSCKGYYIIVLYLLTFPLLSIAASLHVWLDAIFSLVRCGTLSCAFMLIVLILYTMYCAMCNVVFQAARCPVCWREQDMGSPRQDRPQPVESLDAVLMDIEQRGRLIITIHRTGGKTVHLLSLRACALGD